MSRRTVSLPGQAALVVLPLLVAAAILGYGLSLLTPSSMNGGSASNPGGVPTLTLPTRPELHRVPGGGTWAATNTNPDGDPVTWPDCVPIRWAHNPTDMPVGALRDIEEAFRRITDVTGLRFVHVGATDESPAAQRATYQPARYGDGPAPVLIAFVSESGDLPIGPDDRAVTVTVAESDGDRRSLVTAQVLVRPTAGEPGDFTSRARGLGAVLLHEFGHLVGLTHVGDPDEMMFAHPTNLPVAWGAGDLAGLTAVGSSC